MLEESRGYLSSFMVGSVYEQGGLSRPSIPYFFLPTSWSRSTGGVIRYPLRVSSSIFV